MSSDLEREKTEVPCPGGGSPIRTTYGDVAKKSSLKSSKGHEYKFKWAYQSKLKKAMDNIDKLQKDFEKNMIKSQKEFGEAFENVLSNADILLKR